MENKARPRVRGVLARVPVRLPAPRQRDARAWGAPGAWGSGGTGEGWGGKGDAGRHRLKPPSTTPPPPRPAEKAARARIAPRPSSIPKIGRPGGGGGGGGEPRPVGRLAAARAGDVRRRGGREQW